jgi:hypothetical protein
MEQDTIKIGRIKIGMEGRIMERMEWTGMGWDELRR